MDLLEGLFDITHGYWEEYNERKKKFNLFYEWLIARDHDSFLVDEKDCFAHVILTKKRIHFILRKIRKHEKNLG